MPAGRINHLLKKRKVKLVFHTGYVSELNAAKGIIQILNLQAENLRIHCSHEVKKDLAKQMIPNIKLNGHTSNAHYVNVHFDFNVRQKWKENNLILNHEPYKYFSVSRAKNSEKIRTRKKIKLSESRKLIVFSPTHAEEIKIVLNAYQKISWRERPFLVIAPRTPNKSLIFKLRRLEIKAVSRNQTKSSLPNLNLFDVLILNTMGELSNFFKAADLAIVGHDRNLFEPANFGIPVLYFKGPLKLRRDVKKMFRLFSLAWRKNKIAKRLLDQSGAAMPINPGRLSNQITKILGRPEKMIRGIKIAASCLRKKIMPFYRRRLSKLLISKLDG